MPKLIPPETCARIADDLGAGYTYAQVAQRNGVSLRKVGLIASGRGPATGEHVPSDRMIEVLALNACGLTNIEIARKLGTERQNVHQILGRASRSGYEVKNNRPKRQNNS